MASLVLGNLLISTGKHMVGKPQGSTRLWEFMVHAKEATQQQGSQGIDLQNISPLKYPSNT